MTRESLEAEIEKVCRSCAKRGWDGHGGDPLQEKLEGQAKAFSRHIPKKLLENLDIVPDPDGKISFDWELRDDNGFDGEPCYRSASVSLEACYKDTDGPPSYPISVLMETANGDRNAYDELIGTGDLPGLFKVIEKVLYG